MTDMENLDATEEKKSWYAALREKHAQEVASLNAQIEELKAGRAADKKLYFENTMKSRGYEWNFGEFADKYSSLDINDMVALYEWQNWKVSAVTTVPTEPKDDSVWAKSVIEWANPTTEIGEKKLDDMSPEEMIKYAKTQSWYK